MVKTKIAGKKTVFDFNVYAFLFNAFYFLYKKLPGSFCLAVLIEYLFVLAFAFVADLFSDVPAVSFVIAGVLIPHVLTGIYANRYIEYWKARDKAIIKNAKVEYMAVSPLRLLVCSVISFGVYPLYWMYKNWNAIQKATKEPMFPIVRSYILGIFYIYPLLKQIRSNYESVFPEGKNLRPIITGIMLCIFAPILIIMPMLLIAATTAPTSKLFLTLFLTTPIISILLYIVFFILLMKIQQAINSYNEKNFPKNKLRKSLSWGEVLVIVTGVVLVVLSIISDINSTKKQTPYLTTLTEEQQYAIGQMLGDIYRNVYGYAEVCQENGYPIKIYPETFKNIMKDEFELLNKILAHDGLNVDTAINLFIPTHHKQQIKEILLKDLQQMTGSSEGGRKLACIILDAQADKIIRVMSETSKPIYHKTLDTLAD